MRKIFENFAEANGSDRGRSPPAAAMEGGRGGKPCRRRSSGRSCGPRRSVASSLAVAPAVTGVGEYSGLGGSEYPGCWERSLGVDNPPPKALSSPESSADRAISCPPRGRRRTRSWPRRCASRRGSRKRRQLGPVARPGVEPVTKESTGDAWNSPVVLAA